MTTIHLFLEKSNKDIANQLITALKNYGYTISASIVEQFPIADPLSFTFASLFKKADIIVVIISRFSNRTTWLLQEIKTQQGMIDSKGANNILLAICNTSANTPEWVQLLPINLIISQDLNEMTNYIVGFAH
jgi:hypothetical protein